MSDLKFQKVLNSLPSTLQPNTVYMIRVGSQVQMYVSNNAGTSALPVNGVTGSSSGGDVHPFLLMGAS